MAPLYLGADAGASRSARLVVEDMTGFILVVDMEDLVLSDIWFSSMWWMQLDILGVERDYFDLILIAASNQCR